MKSEAGTMESRVERALAHPGARFLPSDVRELFVDLAREVDLHAEALLTHKAALENHACAIDAITSTCNPDATAGSSVASSKEV